jgi:YidC/Oxa1 family membrane protein insertase
VRFASWSSWTSWPSHPSSSPPTTNPTSIVSPPTTPTSLDQVASSSTDPLPTPPIPEIPSSSESGLDIATPLDTLGDFASNVSRISPDQIGYLQSLVMEHIHIYSGTPWWATIAITALAVRLVFFKPFVNAGENNTRMQAIGPVMKPLAEKMQEASKARDVQAVMRYRTEMSMLRKRAGVGIVTGFIPMLQFIPQMGTFFLLREMSNIPVPALRTEGILWFQDLSVADPYFVLPVAAAGILHLVLRVRCHAWLVSLRTLLTLTCRKVARQVTQLL